MLVDEDINTRKKAVDLIKQTRSVTQQNNKIRKFKSPKLITNTQLYYEIVDLEDQENVFEPPLLRNFSIEEIAECISKHKNFVHDMVKDIPCHTQAVERAIQTVSRASRTDFGEDNRHANVCATVQSRSILPKTKTKKNYVNYLNS